MGALGWYAHRQLTEEKGEDWPDQMCYDWFLSDNGADGLGLRWLQELEVCGFTKTIPVEFACVKSV